MFSMIARFIAVLACLVCVTATQSAEDAVETYPDWMQPVVQRRAGGDRSSITVRVPVGHHRLHQTIRLTPDIVGEGLTFLGHANGKSTLSGAMPLESSRRVENQWRYKIPEQIALDFPTRVISINGKLATAARHPNIGYFRIVEATSDRRSGFRYATDNLPTPLDLSKGVCDLVFLHDWSSSRLPVQSIDSETQTLATVGPIGCSAKHYAIDHFEKHPRYWLEGHPDFADVAGEWYVDRANRELVLLAGKESEAPRVEWPILEQLIHASGDHERSIQNLRFENIGFTGSAFPMPDGGYAGAQATMHEPRDASGKRTTNHRPILSAAVLVEDTRECAFTNCQFRTLANSGLWLAKRSKGCLVEKCSFRDLGGNGINLGEDNSRRVEDRVWYQAAPDQVAQNNRILACQLEHCGRVLPGAVAIWCALTKSTEIANNTISDCPYTGISMGWLWNDQPSPAGNNVVSGNQIHHVMQVLSDGGGIYTLGRQPDSRLVSNQISDIPLNAGRAESNGMFLDQGSTGFTIADNTFRRIAKSPLRFHQAGKNSVTRNRWEQETAQSPMVRYNATPEANIQVTDDNESIKKETRTYLIGNSLTWDTQPSLLSGFVQWHVDCGKPLPFIRDNPSAPCVASSRHWPIALEQLQYDYLSVQPHYRSTFDEDVETISAWMRMQPRAIVVIHCGWARSATAAEEYVQDDLREMTHNPAYFDRLISALRKQFPERTFRKTRTTEALHQITMDIKSGVAPIQKITDLYRDAIHMTHGEGRYLMHNLMRVAMDQPLSDTGFDIAAQNPELKRYLDGVIERLRE